MPDDLRDALTRQAPVGCPLAAALDGFQRSQRAARGVLRGRFYVSYRLNGQFLDAPVWARTPAEAIAIERNRLAGCGALRMLDATALPDCLIDGADLVPLRTETEQRAAAARLAALVTNPDRGARPTETGQGERPAGDRR